MDIISDSNFSDLLTVFNTVDPHIPEYVREYDLKQGAEKAAASALFADPDTGSYPINTAADTWISACYHEKEFPGQNPGTGSLAGVVRANIHKAAAVFGVEDDVEDAVALLRAARAPVEPIDKNSDYAFVGKVGSHMARLWPIRDEDEIKEAADRFDTNRLTYLPAIRRQLASNIAKKAYELGMDPCKDLPTSIGTESGLFGFDPEAYMAEVLEQCQRVKDAEIGVVAAGLNSVFEVVDPEELAVTAEKAASLLHVLREMTGDAKHMSTSDIVFSIPPEEIDRVHKQAIHMPRGITLDAAKLAVIPIDMLEPCVGDVPMDGDDIDVDQLAERINDLSPEAKNLLLELLSEIE